MFCLKEFPVAKKYIKFKWTVVPGEHQFARVFNTMGADIDDLTEVFQDISTSFYAHMKEVFAREGAVGSRQVWAPLSSRYRAWKERRYPGRKILELTGSLKRSLTEENNPLGIREIGKDEMVIGTRVSYAVKHQVGYAGPFQRLPQRKIIELTEEVKTDWTKLMHSFIYSKVKKTWSRLKPGDTNASNI